MMRPAQRRRGRPAGEGRPPQRHPAVVAGRQGKSSIGAEGDRVNPPATAVFALTMLATTASGDAYTFAEYDQIFARAGFTRSEFRALPPTAQQAVVSYKG